MKEQQRKTISRGSPRKLSSLICVAAWSVLATTAALAQTGVETVTYGYDSQGRLSTVTNSDTTVTTYVYENSNFPTALTGVIDESNSRYSTWGYGTQGQGNSSTEALGADATSLVYNGNGSVTVTDALGAVRTFTFGRYGDRNLITGISGSQCPTCTEPEATTYDLDGFLSSRTDYNGNVTVYTYEDTRGLELSRTEAYGTPRARTITTQWHPTRRLPIEIAQPNRITIDVYNGQPDPTNDNSTLSCAPSGATLPDGTPIAVLCERVMEETTDATGSSGFSATLTGLSRTWSWTYDSYGRTLTATGPRTDVNDTTTYSYYTCAAGSQCGELQTLTDAVGNRTTFNTYDALGNPLTITDPNGTPITLVYDGRERLATYQVGTDITTFAYYPTGLLQQITLSDGSFVQYSYDAAHRLTDVTDGLGNHIHYGLDAMGNPTSETAYDPNNTLALTRSHVYNTLNELYQDVGAAGTPAVTTTYGYDANGNQTSAQAPLNRNSATLYDELNRLTQITDPASGNTYFGYDGNDGLTSVTDPRGLVTGYQYNGLGDLTQLASPDTGATQYAPDSAGNVHTQTDARGQQGTYSYDAVNRLTQAAYADQTIAFSYDAGANGKGHLTGASDANHSMTWQYDPQGRITGKTQTVGSVNLSAGYTYTNGDLTQLTTPSGQAVVFSYTDHQVSGITVNGTTLLSGVSYDPFGPALGWTWGNGTQEIRLYDTDGNPSQFSSIESTTYSVDAAFRIQGISNTSNPSLSWTYGYDALDRLLSGSTSSTSLGWTYDANGNRLTTSGTPLLTAVSTFTYNDRGRVSSASASGATTTYLYNALGQRVLKSGAAGTVLFFYDEAGHLLGEYGNSGSLIEETLWLGDIPVATLQPNGSGTIGLYYVHADHLDAPKMITRPADNAILWRWDRDPFGTAAANQNPSAVGTFSYNLRLPGQYFDAETGLAYNYQRDAYDSQTGRYNQSDPAGLAGESYSTYSYAFENPLSNSDPTGLAPPGRTATPAFPTVLPPNIAIPGTPENDYWVHSAWQAMMSQRPNASSIPQPNTQAQPAQNCPDPDRCKQLNDDVQKAKAEAAALGSCREGMSPGELLERYDAWVRLATARAIRDETCWNGGDAGHQQQQANNWATVGNCARLLGR